MTSAHLGFILASYVITLAVIGGLVFAIWFEHRRLKREIAALGGVQRNADTDRAA